MKNDLYSINAKERQVNRWFIGMTGPEILGIPDYGFISEVCILNGIKELRMKLLLLLLLCQVSVRLLVMEL